MRRGAWIGVSAAVIGSGPLASAVAEAPPPNTLPRVLTVEYAAQEDRGTLRLTVGDPDGQVVGIRLGGAVTMIADGRGCGPRNGNTDDWVLPIRSLEPGAHPFEAFVTSSTCTASPTIEESRWEFTITVTQDGRASVAGTFGDPFASSGCRVGEQRAASWITEEERAGARRVTAPIVIGCVRERRSRRHYELIAYRLARPSGPDVLCLDTYVPSTGSSYGCASHRVLRGGKIDLTATSPVTRRGPMTVSGATTADVARVTIGYRLRGRPHTRRATLVRVRDAALLRRLQVSRAFGRYLVEVPLGARRLRVRAYDSAGRTVGSARRAP